MFSLKQHYKLSKFCFTAAKPYYISVRSGLKSVMSECKRNEKSDVNLVVTLASTGLKDPGFDPEICQLTLTKPNGQNLFSKYVLPKGSFQQGI